MFSSGNVLEFKTKLNIKKAVMGNIMKSIPLTNNDFISQRSGFFMFFAFSYIRRVIPAMTYKNPIKIRIHSQKVTTVITILTRELEYVRGDIPLINIAISKTNTAKRKLPNIIAKREKENNLWMKDFM